MNKLFLYFRKCLGYLAVLFLIGISSISLVMAAPSKEINNKLEESICIETPTENIKNVPIIGYKLVYQIYDASLVDFLHDKFEELKKRLAVVGIKEKNLVIIFINYDGKISNRDMIFDYKNSEETINQSNNYITDEKTTLDLSTLTKKYSLPFLTAKRKVLIGTIVDNSNLFRGNKELQVANFSFPETKAISLHKNVNEPKLSDDKNKTTNNNNMNNNYIMNNTYEDLVQYRANMISYMNLEIFRKTDFIGMMEYIDLTHRTISYFALPGNINNLLFSNKN